MMDDNSTLGQAFTLEAVFAAILMLSAAVFAIEVAALTPLTSSTSSQQVQNQQGALAHGFLNAQYEHGSLKDAILYWEPSSVSTRDGRWHHKPESSPGEGYTSRNTISSADGFEFGHQLTRTFLSRASAVNVELIYEPSGADDRNYQLINLGTPSADAVTVEKTVVLHDTDRILDDSGTPSGTELQDLNESGFYAPNLDGPIYNVVTIRVTIWRI